MQTTLLGLAIAFILALIAALIGPYLIDWNQFRPQFEAEATKVIGAPVRVAGALDARLLPTPTLRLRSLTVGGANDLGKVRADKLDIEFSLGDLMRGEWRANQLTISGLALDVGLDRQGKLDLPASNGTFNFASLSIDRLNLTGRAALHDAASHTTIELNDIAFSGDVRSLAGSVRGDGSFVLAGTRYPFRISSGQNADNAGTRVHLSIDPGARPLAADLDGVLNFAARVPRFEGLMTLAAPPQPKPKTGETASTPWKISARVKVDHAAALLDQIEASYGVEERALKFAGSGDVRFGASPLLHVALAARQLDADRFFAKDDVKDDAKNDHDNGKDNGNPDTSANPARLLSGMRTLMAKLPQPPLPAKIEVNAEQIMLGGRPLQTLSAELHSNALSWSIDRLDVRAPGATEVSFQAAFYGLPADANAAPAGSSGDFSGAFDIASSDPDVLMAWLQGRADVALRSQKPLRVGGAMIASADHFAIDGLKAEIDGGAVEGHVALTTPPAGGISRLEAALTSNHLDLDEASALVRSLAGPDPHWPEQATVSLDAGSAVSSGQEWRPFKAKFAYSPNAVSLEQLKIGRPNGVMLEGAGNFDRVAATGRLDLTASAGSLGGIGTLVAPFAPRVAARFDAMASPPGPTRLKLALDLGKITDKTSEQADHGNARAVLDLDAPQLKGTVTITAKPELGSLRAADVDRLRHSEINVESKLLATRGDSLIALLGLDHAVAAGDGAAQFQGTASFVWGTPLRLDARLWGAGLDGEAEGTAEPWADVPTASVNLKVRSVNLAPLFGFKPSDRAAQNIRLFAHAALAGNRLTLDDLDSVATGSRLRGHLAVTLDQGREVEGEIGLDTLDLPAAFAFAIGAAGHAAAEPLGEGLVQGWRGRVAFQALSGVLPGGSELRPLSGVVKSDGQSLTLDALKGRIGDGEVSATIDARPGVNGMTLNAHVELAGVDGGALHYRGLKMPAGRTSLEMTLMSQGRSVQALLGALSGSGTATLEKASIAGLDPRAFDVALHASDLGQATGDTRLRQIVEPVLSAGVLPVDTAQIPFTIRDGRLRIDATTLDSQGARAIISGGYDIPADQADIRASLSSTSIGSQNSRPEIQLFAAGSPDALNRTVDVTGLSSWLAVRAIDRETRRLDSIERGEPPPTEPPFAPPST
ncbi:AsmA family protein, partial [Bradyrhizobium sp.]|uniref:AsmA family protein n=1 Tax=Bradyrhizobium sp. TaxID=376 RepID=UPI003C33264E